MARKNRLMLHLLFGVLFFSCSPAYKKYISNYQVDPPGNTPDYSKLEYWAAHPDKWDPSDSVPAPLLPGMIKFSDVDVFFLHPTTFGSSKDTAWNADINDPLINAKTDYMPILYQGSVFNECRVFAPRYRQANIRAYYTKDTQQAVRAFDIAYEDIKKAFEYYLVHYNQGHAIIIASHSQGSTHAIRLLKEFFDGKPLKSKLVAAYIIGMRVPKNSFSELNACRDSAATGCLVGWRTFKTGYEPEFIKEENGDSYVTNPLTWTSTNVYAPKSIHHGAILKKFNTLYNQLADAQIHDDVLWIHKPHFPGSIFYRSKNYHVGDINLFYLSIRDNIRMRIHSYIKN